MIDVKLRETHLCQMKQNHQLCTKTKKVIDRGKISKKLSEVRIWIVLLHRLANMEHQCQANTQYLRQECVDIIDIHIEVEADVLEEKFVNIFEKLGCNIPSNRTEARHRVSIKSATVAIKFSRKKDYQ